MASQAAPWLLIVLYLAFSTFTVESAGAEEGEALLRFKSTLSIDLPSWIPGPAPCIQNSTNWEGVICFNSRVWGIQLENRGLAGTLNLRPLIPLPGLRTISFMGNKLEGPLPPDLKLLGALKAVYLSRNKFSGEIPADEFAGMRSLKKLFLSNNGFFGPIPESIVGLGRLLELRLDHNEFAGGIPSFRQPRLTIVDVSFNRLEGDIPKRLSRMDPSLFQGNPKLCGAPLTVICNNKIEPAKHGGRRSGWPISLIIIIACIISFLLVLLLLLAVRRRRKTSEEIGPPFATTEHAVDKLELGAAAGQMDGKISGGRKSECGGGRLAFVQEGRERFELDDLLMGSAEVLGSGNFGSSYKTVMSAGPTVVVKRFKEMNGVGRDEFNEHMRRIGRLSHPNLLPLIAYSYKRNDKLLVTEFIANGSLAHMLHGNRGSTLPPLDWPTRLKIVKGVARGLAYLYQELPALNLPHGHLKSSNVLLNDTFQPLLTDYALVPVMSLAHATQVMIAYKSPEVNQSGRPSKKSDIWSLGILILEILTGKFPANFLHKGSGGTGTTDLATWVKLVMEDEWNSEVFDGDMRDTENGRGEMQKLLKIGLDCCEEIVENRMEMREALERIEQLKERDD